MFVSKHGTRQSKIRIRIRNWLHLIENSFVDLDLDNTGFRFEKMFESANSIGKLVLHEFGQYGKQRFNIIALILKL
jgi:hypothetical protein